MAVDFDSVYDANDHKCSAKSDHPFIIRHPFQLKERKKYSNQSEKLCSWQVIKKLCEGFQATLYPCPEEVSDRTKMIVNVVSRIEDLNTVLCRK